MKNFIIPMFVFMIAWSCSSTRNSGTADSPRSVIIDSTQYEIIIIDTEFDTWYLMNYAPSKDRSNEFYRSQNQIGVFNWNDYFNRGRYLRVIENYIYYEPSKDYGIEVNRKLYWYFKFVEDKYKIRLLSYNH